MLRELDMNEMEMVSGGAEDKADDDIIVVTGTKTNGKKVNITFNVNRFLQNGGSADALQHSITNLLGLIEGSVGFRFGNSQEEMETNSSLNENPDVEEGSGIDASPELNSFQETLLFNSMTTCFDPGEPGRNPSLGAGCSAVRI